jgi:hypothetical protein
MKKSAAAISTLLALLLAAAVPAQTRAQMVPSGPRGISKPAAIQSPALVRPSFPVRPPSLIRSFGRHAFFRGAGLIVTTSEVAVPTPYAVPYPVYVQYPAYGQAQAQYWAYCQSPQGYYPYVTECPGGWLPVAPTSTPPPLLPGQVSSGTGPQAKESPAGGMPIEEIRQRIARSRAD